MWILRHAFAIAVLPLTVAILVPLWISRRFGVEWRMPATASDWVLAAFAVAFFILGATLFVNTLFLFATRGRGTLAPWDPPAHLVIRGPYRFVRNPMISGVLFIVVSESLFLRSLPHAAWAAIFLLMNLIYIPLLEEPQLEQRFGDEYRRYKRDVPRFLPAIRSANKKAASRRPET